MSHHAGRWSPITFGEVGHHRLGAFSHRRARQEIHDVVPDVGAVVVGVDDSPDGDAAVDQAIVEAQLRHWNLQLLHVQPAGTAVYPARDQGPRLLERMAERAHACAPGVPVSSHLAIGAAATVLLAELADTDLLVVGHPGTLAGAAFGLRIGERVAARHRGPALVVRAPGRPAGSAGRPIVVGTDDPSRRTLALDFARSEARLRNCELIVLHATGDDPVPEVHHEIRDGVRVHHRAVAGDPIKALLVASEGAAAVAVGRHSGAGVATASVGPVGQALIRGASCPVFLIG